MIKTLYKWSQWALSLRKENGQRGVVQTGLEVVELEGFSNGAECHSVDQMMRKDSSFWCHYCSGELHGEQSLDFKKSVVTTDQNLVALNVSRFFKNMLRSTYDQ